MNFNSTDQYGTRFKEQLDVVSLGLSSSLSRATELSATSADKLIVLLLECACQAQNTRNITLGREAAKELPRRWLLQRIEKVADQVLNLDGDPWEYRRFLELLNDLDRDLLIRLVNRGLASKDVEIVETANEFKCDW